MRIDFIVFLPETLSLIVATPRRRPGILAVMPGNANGFFEA